MRLVTLRADPPVAGVVENGLVTRLDAPLEALLAQPRDSWEIGVRRTSDPMPIETVRLDAPVARPGKIVAIGMNYRDHCIEQGIEPPLEPLVFAKFPTSIVGPDVEVSWPADVTDVDWEVELGIIVGIDDDGQPTVAGYTIANDVSARQLQTRDGQFVRAKSIDTFCPLGPAMVTPEELPDPLHVSLSLEVNGTVMQQSNTDQLLFDVAEVMTFCRHFFSLEPGDVILTGTPPGVGVFRKPPVFLAAGDVMVARIEGIGQLRTPVLGPRLP